MKELLMKYKEIIMYLVFGVLTTVVNIVVYFLSAELLHINYLISNALAWFLSVLFAYITNRKYVFESANVNILNEALKFVGARVTTLIIDMLCMAVFVSAFRLNDKVSKILVQVIVFLLNYIFSKFFVFKQKND